MRRETCPECRAPLTRTDDGWLRALGHQMLGAPVVDLPKAHLAALDRLRLPGGVS